MSEVTKFNLFGQDVTIKDSTGRQQISSTNKRVDSVVQQLRRANTNITKNSTAISLGVNLSYTVILGDSYTEGYLLPDPENDNWAAQFVKLAKIPKHQIFGQGGTGFGKTGDLQQFNATTYFNKIKTEIESPEDVTAFIVCLGWNDRSNQAVLSENVDKFWSTVKAYLPNAKLLYFVNPSFTVLRKQCLDILYDRAEAAGVITFNSYYWQLLDAASFNADRVHPSKEGAYRIAGNLLSCLCGGSVYHYAAIGLENVADGWTANITSINEMVYIFATGTKQGNSNTLTVGSWPQKIFDGNGGSTSPQISGSQLVQFTNSDLNFGYFMWNHGDTTLACKSMYKVGTSSPQYSAGRAVLNIALPAVMFLG